VTFAGRTICEAILMENTDKSLHYDHDKLSCAFKGHTCGAALIQPSPDCPLPHQQLTLLTSSIKGPQTNVSHKSALSWFLTTRYMMHFTRILPPMHFTNSSKQNQRQTAVVQIMWTRYEQYIIILKWFWPTSWRRDRHQA